MGWIGRGFVLRKWSGWLASITLALSTCLLMALGGYVYILDLRGKVTSPTTTFTSYFDSTVVNVSATDRQFMGYLAILLLSTLIGAMVAIPLQQMFIAYLWKPLRKSLRRKTT